MWATWFMIIIGWIVFARVIQAGLGAMKPLSLSCLRAMLRNRQKKS